MKIVAKMATLQEKKTKMVPKKRLFLKNPPFFWTFETSSWFPTSNRLFWLEPIYWDINFVLKCPPAQCVRSCLNLSRLCVVLLRFWNLSFWSRFWSDVWWSNHSWCLINIFIEIKHSMSVFGCFFTCRLPLYNVEAGISCNIMSALVITQVRLVSTSSE